jgi:hypothetical protein
VVQEDGRSGLRQRDGWTVEGGFSHRLKILAKAMRKTRYAYLEQQ